MASILQAAKWMQEGKQVQRQNVPDWVLAMKPHRCFNNQLTLGAIGKDGRFFTATRIEAADLLADDWQLAD